MNLAVGDEKCSWGVYNIYRYRYICRHGDAERGQLDEMCASHDLAPTFQYAFEIKYDEKAKEDVIKYDEKAKEDVMMDLTNLSLTKKESKGKQLVKKASKMFRGKEVGEVRSNLSHREKQE